MVLIGFHLMLNTALSDYPDAEIILKIHPDVLAGKRQGHFSDVKLDELSPRPRRVRVYAEDVNPIALCQAVDAVYTVNSGMGFEALLAGCAVTTFAWPWYAGWGLTSDRYPGSRRGVSRSLDQLFAAAYRDYSRYWDPVAQQPCDLSTIIDRLVDHIDLAA